MFENNEEINAEIREEIKRKKKEEWFDVWFAIEALAVSKDVVENSLKNHIEKLKQVREAFVYETKFDEARYVEKPMKDVAEGYAQIVEVKLFVKNLNMLLNIVMTYGPSAIEILGPNKKEIDIGEVQNITNTVAAIVHQFAAAGVGGIVITPK
jgi:predicted AlkP superfamily phosphohydrolase/phosphomutase